MPRVRRADAPSLLLSGATGWKALLFPRQSAGEYSISAIGPGPRARRHWELARRRGLKTIAKIQADNTWELSAVTYLPALANVAQHVANLRQANVDGLMLFT